MRNVRRYGNHEALFDPSIPQIWSYKELNAEANKLANAILEKGVTKGDVVMFRLCNCPEFIFTYLACHKIGAIACPINFRISAGEVAQTIDDSMPTVFVYSAEDKSDVAQALADSKHKPTTVIAVEDEAHTTPIPGASLYRDFTRNIKTLYIRNNRQAKGCMLNEYKRGVKCTRCYDSLPTLTC